MSDIIRDWHDYFARRSFPAGRSSTLKKTAKLNRLRGYGLKVLPKYLTVHNHPRYKYVQGQDHAHSPKAKD